DLAGLSITTLEALTISGTGVSGSGALFNSGVGSPSVYAGAVTLGLDTSIVATTASISLTNAATIAGGAFNLPLGGAATGSAISAAIGTATGMLTKTGAGSWTLFGANTNTGDLTINGGTLALASTSTIPTTVGVFVNATGVLSLAAATAAGRTFVN